MEQNIISKIEKLLSLAGNNPSEAEAQAAMLKAQQLMAEHNISMESIQEQDPSQKEIVQEWVKGGQSCQWMRGLAQVIANNFRCTFLVGRGYGLVFVGVKEDVGICIQVFNFASHTLDRNMMKLRRQYRKQGQDTSGISGDYSSGFIKGLKDKFQEQVEKKGWGLVLVKDKAVTEYVEQIKDKKGPAKPGKALTKSGNSELFNKGYKDGKSLADPHKALA